MTTHSFELGEVAPIRYFLSIALVLGLLFSMVTDSQHALWIHLLRWMVQSIVPMALMILSYKVLGHLAWFYVRDPWLKLVLSGSVGALLFVPGALLLDIGLQDDPVPTSLLAWLGALGDEIRGVVPPVVLCWLAINAPWVMGFKIVSPSEPIMIDHASEQSTANCPSSAFDALNQLLPANKRGELHYLKSELHYLLVVTSAGHTLILANLKDAIRDFPVDSGIQPHRSFWVNNTAIRALRKDGREGVLVLTNGIEIPVSRHRFTAVRQFLAQHRIQAELATN